MSFMLDTNACIGIINGASGVLRERLLEVSPTAVTISQIVHYELAFGVCNSQQQERNSANLQHFLAYIRVLEWGNAQSVEAARIRCELLRQGRPIGHYDILIAAHARSLGATLVTHNYREFSRVEGLCLADWEVT